MQVAVLDSIPWLRRVALKDSQVTAIDLSISSLAYAKRKTEELGVTNIDYMQADILDLGLLDKHFDIVESVGVIHHMDEPIAGWRVLTDCLKPGGLMRLGLYSELARQSVVKARNIVTEDKILVNYNDMSLFRRRMIEKDNPLIEFFRRVGDFYSMSNFRDLLFHVQEHRFTIPQISEILNELGLVFIGFEVSDNRVMTSFKKRYPEPTGAYDLDKWHAFELLNPLTFVGMYQFWLQKL